jgi:hypothetical protein
MFIRKAQALIKVVTRDLDIQNLFSEMVAHHQYLESEVDERIETNL